jgi:hypothetical protein
MPAFLTMVDIPQAIANLGMARAGDRDAAKLALVTAKRTAARSKHSFYAATALRLQAQAELLLGNGQWRRTLDRAATGNMTKIDLLAIAALRGERVDFGAFAPAVAWNTGGAIH